KGPPDRGGISAFMQTLLAGELKASHRIGLLNLYRDEVLRGGQFTRANVARTLADARSLWRASRQVDIVHINTALVPSATLLRAGLLALVARAAGARAIVHAHSGRIDLWLTTPLRRLLVRLALAPADRVLTVSESSRRHLARSLGSARVTLVDTGTYPSGYGPVEPAHQPPAILFAGVLSPRKGLIDLIKASSLLQRRGLAHQLLVVGGPPEEGPQAEAETLEAANGAPVQFLGTQPHDEMARLYRGVDVFCLPSWWEAMPLTILEAMASGLPVVASTVGDIPRTIIVYQENISFDHYFGTFGQGSSGIPAGAQLFHTTPEGMQLGPFSPFRLDGTTQSSTCDVDHDYGSMIAMADGGAMDHYL